jgi:outer membrane protein assembly factor BamA
MRMSFRPVWWMTLAVSSVFGQQRFPLVQMEVHGQEVISEQAILRETRLEQGQLVEPSDLEAAAQRLRSTGFFRDVTFRYRPSNGGYAVRFTVSEHPMDADVRIEVPGIPAEQIWERLAVMDPFLQRYIPTTDAAEARYRSAVEAVLRDLGKAQPIATRTDTDPGSGVRSLILRPASLPRIVALQFDGARVVAVSDLERVMTRVATGKEFSETEFRRLLEANIQPLYEEAARYAVHFPAVRTEAVGDGVRVITSIDEGPEFRVGEVTVRGDSLPAAETQKAARFERDFPARWSELLRGVAALEKPLHASGYLDARAAVERRLEDEMVHLAIEIRKGPLYRFRSLELRGLRPDQERLVNSKWRLRPGDPFRMAALNEFLHEIQQDRRLTLREIAPTVRRSPESSEVDVLVDFR